MTIVRVNGATSSKMVQSTASSFSSPYFIAGKTTGGYASLVYVTPDGTTTPVTKLVTLSDYPKGGLPSPYPNSFVINGKSFLLFMKGSSSFALYSQTSNTSLQLAYTLDTTTFDFSAVSNLAKNSSYSSSSSPWFTTPIYSASRKTLYFTVSWLVKDSIKGDYIKMRIHQSKLDSDSKTFLSPTEVAGDMDPLSATHYVDGKSHTWSEFFGRMGGWWIGRMYLSSDGTKAFFTVISAGATKNTTPAMKSGDPFIAPTPNNQDFGTFTYPSITLTDSRIIRTYICSADVDSNGNFSNITQLPSTVNTGGINYVSDISDDGTSMVVSHMDIGSTFAYTWGYLSGRTDWWGADGLTSALMTSAPWDIPPWTGYPIVWKNVGGTWTQIYSTTNDGTPVIN